MRRFFVLLLTVCAASGQIGDAVRTLRSRTPTGSSTLQVVRNANGREVPVSRSEDVVLSDSGGIKVIERTVRQFDANGNPGPPEKVRIETRTKPDGTAHTLTTVRRADVNGNLGVVERRTEVLRKSGSESVVEITIERPTANAGFAVVEKTEQQERAIAANHISSSSTTWQRDSNGRLVEVTKRTAERRIEGDKALENAAEYESASTGQMRLMRQTVTRAGSATTEVEVYEPRAVGFAAANDAKPQLTKRQVFERVAQPDGITESISVQFPSPNDPRRLSPLQKVEESICRGDCGQK